MPSIMIPTQTRRGDPRRQSCHASVVSTIGGTPLIALDRLFDFSGFKVFGKCERFNPGGSIKDRTARAMIEWALKTGAVVPGRSTVVESTSGNLGIALAQLCNFYGLDLVCVTDPKATTQNVSIMRAYGARIEMVDHRDPATGEYLPVRLARVRSLLASIPDAYWPNQYANEQNCAAHHVTMREIHEALDGEVDYLFCSTGTCGTLRGCAEFVRENGLDVTVVAVDAVGSVSFGVTPEEAGTVRRIPGHGMSVPPPLLQPGLADRIVKVTDADCVAGCRQLLAKESILTGGSSGAVISAVLQASDWIPPGSTCVAILPDGGDRYLDTIYSDAWVASNIDGASTVTGRKVP